MTCNVKVILGAPASVACASARGVELRLGPGVPGLDADFNFEGMGMERCTIALAWPPSAKTAERNLLTSYVLSQAEAPRWPKSAQVFLLISKKWSELKLQRL